VGGIYKGKGKTALFSQQNTKSGAALETQKPPLGIIDASPPLFRPFWVILVLVLVLGQVRPFWSKK
jgi:hypothetical protein